MSETLYESSAHNAVKLWDTVAALSGPNTVAIVMQHSWGRPEEETVMYENLRSRFECRDVPHDLILTTAWRRLSHFNLVAIVFRLPR
mmetsp:Transcript_83091/g.189819  ORF Transcript_83091/g.189819 Transcript_83091/m.189819 type:complete len:87 (+) Transcript_83091:636-896(+)